MRLHVIELYLNYFGLEPKMVISVLVEYAFLFLSYFYP